MSDWAVRLRGVTKSFGDVVALHPTDLDIGAGEFFSVLGPSGSGKTTVLRLIAGFENPDAGTVFLGDDDVTSRSPNSRDVNTVFQDYALFPHMSVRENVEYGLKVKKVARAERQAAAERMLEIVRLDGFADRLPNQLSGGQRQRVALARALVNEPKVLLLDEPLGALDLKLREEMQVELKAIQQRLGITFVYVTHDQGEALSMSDRVAVFNKGRVEQVGSPRDIYESPATEFVAGFVGTNNLLSVATARALFGDMVASTANTTNGMVALRPERLALSTSKGKGSVRASVTALQYLGADTRVHLATDSGTSLVSIAPSENVMGIAVGHELWVAVGES